MKYEINPSILIQMPQNGFEPWRVRPGSIRRDSADHKTPFKGFLELWPQEMVWLGPQPKPLFALCQASSGYLFLLWVVFVVALSMIKKFAVLFTSGTSLL